MIDPGPVGTPDVTPVDEAAIVAVAKALVGFDVPIVAISGVAMNLGLLRDHAAKVATIR